MRASRPFAIAGLAASLVIVPFATPLLAQQAQPAVASAQQKVDINVFYEPLAEHGTWVAHPDYKYVWIPKGMDSSWRPYQEGRWLWTDAGWYWESGEPFAWATYHYGRWGYDPDYGWFWVPGDTWAPAWVTWRRGGGQIGWAPIAPQGAGYAMGVPKRYDAPVAESWVVVRENDILAEDLALRAEPVSELSVWWDSGPQVYEPAYDNGIVVTRFIDEPEIARVTRTDVVTRQVVQVNRYDQEFIDGSGARIGIYRPAIAQITATSIPAPARVVRTVNADQRVTIRQYAREGFIGAGPSAALLGALGVEQRRDLRQARWQGDEQAYRRDIQRFQERERDAIARERQEAQRDQRAFEDRRREMIQQRMQSQRQALQQREQRAGDAVQRLNPQPAAAPAPAPNAAAPAAPNAATPSAPAPNASAPGTAAPPPPPSAARTPAAPMAPASQPPNAQARPPQAAPNADTTGSMGRPDARTPPSAPQSPPPPPQGAARETPAGQRQQPGAPPPPSSEARRSQPDDDAPNRNPPPPNRDPNRGGQREDGAPRADQPQQPKAPQAERTPDKPPQQQQQRPNQGDRGPDQPRPAQAERPPQAPPQAQQPPRQQEQRSQQPQQPSPRQSQSDAPRPAPQAAPSPQSAPPPGAQRPQGGGGGSPDRGPPPGAGGDGGGGGGSQGR